MQTAHRGDAADEHAAPASGPKPAARPAGDVTTVGAVDLAVSVNVRDFKLPKRQASNAMERTASARPWPVGRPRRQLTARFLKAQPQAAGLEA
eukprot:CAMPEP_0170610294 /NCGR_PEP_ID=MMETSP0224-20130122/22580_1 /TAXON_ID=285029 /ORGANISM="Togula jolla, Strain CCCM 725" /LENGTH=92 /DNA_ID=CAMNT_0010935655 /DNA_START=795 /DNA_END=1071 /DNA_ORIENTATION=+